MGNIIQQVSDRINCWHWVSPWGPFQLLTEQKEYGKHLVFHGTNGSSRAAIPVGHRLVESVSVKAAWTPHIHKSFFLLWIRIALVLPSPLKWEDWRPNVVAPSRGTSRLASAYKRFDLAEVALKTPSQGGTGKLISFSWCSLACLGYKISMVIGSHKFSSGNGGNIRLIDFKFLILCLRVVFRQWEIRIQRRLW